jgi:NAD(P)-dependent dehydrogenase (short-subunit alcohol dehydrogenase family)
MKTAIITGGTRGIGLGIAQCMARDGYNLVLGYHANHEAAQRTKDNLEKEYNIQVSCCSGDIALPETMEKLFEIVSNNFNNELTAFVHNAGLYVGVTTETTDIQPKVNDDFASVFDYYQKVYPCAFKRGLQLALKCTGLRHVIAVSSPGCNCNQTPQLSYEMPGQAKASMEFLVRIHARLLAEQDINVNCVIPGLTKTEAWDCLVQKNFTNSDRIDTLVKNSPAGRFAEPSEIGEVVAFLCSSRGRFITGVALPIDGGLHLMSGN